MSFTGKSESFLNKTISNDGFFPDLNLGEFQKVYRVPAEYTQDLVEQKLRLSISDCNLQLAVQKVDWIQQGVTKLEDMDTAIGGFPVMVEQYKSAVYSRAKGLLLMEFPTFNRREQAENEAKESPGNLQYYLAQSGRAVRRLLGLPENVSVELL